MKTKAFSYVRTSGLGQAKGDGFLRQRDVIARFAKANRIELVQEFLDSGVSGTKDGFDREGLTALFVTLKSNGVKLVLTENADRIARDLMVSEIILNEFRSIGVRVVAADSGTDLTVEDGEPTKKMVRQILASISEFEKTRIVQKLRASRMRIRKADGRCEGRKPYGFTEHEKAVIAKMLAYRSEGLSIVDIANRLNTDGVKPQTHARAGKETKWHATQVRRVLGRVK